MAKIDQIELSQNVLVFRVDFAKFPTSCVLICINQMLTHRRPNIRRKCVSRYNHIQFGQRSAVRNLKWLIQTTLRLRSFVVKQLCVDIGFAAVKLTYMNKKSLFQNLPPYPHIIILLIYRKESSKQVQVERRSHGETNTNLLCKCHSNIVTSWVTNRIELSFQVFSHTTMNNPCSRYNPKKHSLSSCKLFILADHSNDPLATLIRTNPRRTKVLIQAINAGLSNMITMKCSYR
jgi:hypothetical protein